MESKNIIFLFFFIWKVVCVAQNDNDNKCGLKYIDEKYYDRHFFILGEMHFNQLETAEYQIKLINLFAEKGVKKINLYFEAPPSIVYSLYEYYRTNDSSYLLDEGIKNNFKTFMLLLNQFKDMIDFNFIPIDIEFNETFNSSIRLRNEILRSIENEKINNFKKAKSKKAYQKESLKILKDSALLSNIKKQVSPIHWNLFYENLFLVNSYGFYKGGRSKKAIKMREQYMSKAIEKNFNLNEISILTIGRKHIIPQGNKLSAELFTYFKKLKRSDCVLMPIIYKNFYWLHYNKKSYPREANFDTLIETEIFDIIIIPCR